MAEIIFIADMVELDSVTFGDIVSRRKATATINLDNASFLLVV
jgi:hypothetical protein